VTPPDDNSHNGSNPLYERSYTGWIILACVIVAVILGIYLKSGHNDRHTAAINSRPAVSAPATTGSGTQLRPVPADRPPSGLK
jgi:hypothetical protein